MNAKQLSELADQISEQVLGGEVNHTIFVTQKRPYTFVSLYLHINGEIQSADAFAKVCYPDKWSKKEGVRMATRKAVKAIVREAVTGDPKCEATKDVILTSGKGELSVGTNLYKTHG